MSNRFGPAGIFSTDNPVSDQMQIDAEMGPDDEYLFGDTCEYAGEDHIFGSWSAVGRRLPSAIKEKSK